MTSSKGGNDEQSQVLAICCVHAYVYKCTQMVPNSASQTSHMLRISHGYMILQFHRKSKVSLEHSRWPLTQSQVHVSTKHSDEDLLVVST